MKLNSPITKWLILVCLVLILWSVLKVIIHVCVLSSIYANSPGISRIARSPVRVLKSQWQYYEKRIKYIVYTYFGWFLAFFRGKCLDIWRIFVVELAELLTSNNIFGGSRGKIGDLSDFDFLGGCNLCLLVSLLVLFKCLVVFLITNATFHSRLII